MGRSTYGHLWALWRHLGNWTESFDALGLACRSALPHFVTFRQHFLFLKNHTWLLKLSRRATVAWCILFSCRPHLRGVGFSHTCAVQIRFTNFHPDQFPANSKLLGRWHWTGHRMMEMFTSLPTSRPTHEKTALKEMYSTKRTQRIVWCAWKSGIKMS